MSDFIYTHSFNTQGTSTGIHEVYYSEPDKILFVEFHNGNLAGYEEVPAGAYHSLAALNESKINGLGGSVGNYYNTYVKNKFPGFSTEGITLLSQEEDENLARIGAPLSANEPENDGSFSSFWSQIYNENKFDEVQFEQSNTEAPASDVSDYSVRLEADNLSQSDLPLVASSTSDAAEKVIQISKIAGWRNVHILSVTQHFS